MTDAELLADFHARREAAVVAPQGNLALVNTQLVDSPQTIWGVPGTWAPAEGGLVVTAEASDGIVVDGRLVDGAALVVARGNPDASEVRFSDTLTGFVITTAEGSHGLRVWDAESDGIRDFGSISAYPYDADWVVPARLVDGELRFTRDGVDYGLETLPSGQQLQVVFSDATSGVDTYSVGRFLFVTPDDDGSVILDFNRAVLPPCAFSYNFTCPIPPAQNRFTVPVEAGEKNVLTRAGELMHG